MVRVLQVLQNYPPEFRGGVEQCVESLCAGLPAHGYEAVVFCGSEELHDQAELIESTVAGVRVLRAHRGRVLRNPVDPFDAAISGLYEDALAQIGPDVVHVHHWWNLSDDLVRRAARRGVPVVVTLHDAFSTCSLFFRNPHDADPCELTQSEENCGPCLATRFPYAESLLAGEVTLRKAAFPAECAAASALLAPSDSHAREIERFLDGAEVTGMPIGSRPLTPPDARTGESFPAGPLRILHFGNLSVLKGTQDLVDAVRAADPEGNAIKLRLAGTLMEGLDVGPAEHVGDYDVDSLRALAADADLAVFTSLAKETYGLCVDEALRLGLPVVVGDRGALGERIGGRGVVVPAGDVEALAATLRGFLDDPETLLSLASAPAPRLPEISDHVAAVAAVYDRVRAGFVPKVVDVERPLLARLAHQSRILTGLLAPALDAGPKETEDSMNADTAIHPRVPIDETGELVSVIIRTRNRPAMLAEALESVAAQTWPHREAVVCNDGGEDVGAIVDAVRDRLDVTLLNPGGVGRCRAANHAIEHARGTWISWLDDDDLYLPDHLETLITAARDQDLDVAYSDSIRSFCTAGEDGRWVETRRDEPHPKRPFDRLKMIGVMPFHLVSLFQHRRTLELVGGFDPEVKVLEDMDLIFRLSQNYEPTRVPRTTAIYRIRDDESNAVTALKREFMETRTQLLRRYAHIILPSLAEAMEEGRDHIAALVHRVGQLETELKRRDGGDGA